MKFSYWRNWIYYMVIFFIVCLCSVIGVYIYVKKFLLIKILFLEKYLLYCIYVCYFVWVYLNKKYMKILNWMLIEFVISFFFFLVKGLMRGYVGKVRNKWIVKILCNLYILVIGISFFYL